MRRFLLAALCAVLFMGSLPGRPQSVIVNPPVGDINPIDHSVVDKPQEDATPVVLTIEEPAYVGMPIWATVRFHGAAANMQADLRYPLTATPSFMPHVAFQVKHEGKLLAPRDAVLHTSETNDAPASGNAGAPATAPNGRFPLHLCYRFDVPGVYTVRYVLQQDPGKKEAPPSEFASSWVTVTVLPYSDEQRRQWQQTQLAHPPTDAVLLVGDYLPALLASPDATVLPAFITALHHGNAFVNNYAVQSLAYFDDEAWSRALCLEIEQNASTDQLVWLLNSQRKLTEAAQTRFVATLIPLLEASEPIRMEGALHALSLLHDRVTPKITQHMDMAVLAAAPHVLATGNAAVCSLALYLGGVKTEQSRKWLWQLTDNHLARTQALRSLCRIGDKRDARRLDDEMRKSLSL